MIVRPLVVYSIWDSRTDELVILDGSAQACAQRLKKTLNAFYALCYRARRGKFGRWHITQRELGPDDVYIGGDEG